MKEPKYLPVLKPENMYEGLFQKDGDENCRCLVGWARYCWNYGSTLEIPNKVRHALLQATGRDYLGGVYYWNDTHTPEERVAAWDRFCALLGYTEEVPA